MSETVVLGAGLAGLGFCSVIPTAEVYEAKSYPGGHVASHDLKGVAFDEGAHILHSKSADFQALTCGQAGDVAHISRSVVQNYYKGSWSTYPVQNNLHELPLEDRVPALTDLVLSHTTVYEQNPVNYREWCERQYGAFLTERYYDVFTTKYWRTAMDKLNTDWLGGRLLPSVLKNIISGAFHAPSASQAVFNAFRYPVQGGFYGFFKTSFQQLNLHLNEAVAEIDTARKVATFRSGRRVHYENLASSIPLGVLVDCIKDLPTDVHEAARLLRHTQMLCVNVLVNQPNVMPCHWCYVYDHALPPARISCPTLLGCAMPMAGSAIQAEIFRAMDEDMPADALTEETLKVLGDLFHFDPARDVIAAQAVPVRYAYVISDLNRAKAVDTILAALKARGVYSMGLYGKWQYLWSDFAYASGVQAAQELKRSKGELCLN